MDFLNNYLIYLIPAFGLIGIAFMAVKAAWVTKQDAGDGDMFPAVLPKLQLDVEQQACNHDLVPIHRCRVQE